MTNYINKKYLDKGLLLKLKDKFLKSGKVQYLIMDDFINTDYFSIIEKQSVDFLKLDHRKEDFVSNRTIYIEGKESKKLFYFFQSNNFLQILNFLYGLNFERYTNLDLSKVKLSLGIEKEGAVAQLYEKGDFTRWHTDTSKDMKREELISKGGYSLWNDYFIDDFEEVGAFIYYINNSNNEYWDSSFGGNLELGEIIGDKMKIIKTIIPKKNRLVFFKTTNYSYHRVSKILKNELRISFQDLLINYKNKPDESTRHIYYRNM